MAYKIKLTNEAKNDFKSMFNYYLNETQNTEYTHKIIQDIKSNVDNLKMFPFRCPPLNPDDETIRALYYKRYAIIYEIQADLIIILNVKHTSRLT